MKIQELRIGNKVSFKDTVVEIAGVSGIVYSFGAIDVTIFREGKTEMHDLKTLSPIPLTEEILLKCGFSDKNYKQGYIGIDYKSGAMTLDFVLNKPGVMGNWNKCHTFSLPDYRFVNIDYLHQLQNLFFDLTGEKLEVKL